MPTTSYKTATDQYVTIGKYRIAFRQFGQPSGIPLFMHMHFRGTMDHWDPKFIDQLALARNIIIMDSAGVGRSSGEIPTTYAHWAQVVLDFLGAIQVKEVDVFGFSMGGCAAQMIALNAPKGLVRKLILAGTVPSIGEGVVRAKDMVPFIKLRGAKTKEEHLDAFLHSFFGPSERIQTAGRESFDRIQGSRPNRVDYVEAERLVSQVQASMNFQNLELATDGSYDRFHELTMPVLIANGMPQRI